jgi:tetratricopeptide (TPR) repeat protein
VKEFLRNFSPSEKLRFQYLLGKPGLPDADTRYYAGSNDPMQRFLWSQVKKRSGLPWYADLQFACIQAPDRIDFLYRKALADEETGRLTDYMGILERNSLHPEANLNMGYAELQAGNYLKAEQYFRNALKGNPDKTLARENLARCFLESGKFSDARKELMRLIRANPNETRYKLALSSIP